MGDDKSLLIKKFEDKYGLKAVFEFKNEVKNIVRVCNMGNHWMDCVAIKLLTGKTFVPPVTFSITAKKQKKTVSINLGPHTTRGDLESVWTKIEKIQQDIWPRIKRSKISKKSLDNTFLLMKYVKLMKPKLEKKEWENALKYIKTTDTDPDEKEEAIKNLQKTIVELEKEELKNGEIICKLWDDDSNDFTNISKREDKKRADRLRQVRKRKEATL